MCSSSGVHRLVETWHELDALLSCLSNVYFLLDAHFQYGCQMDVQSRCSICTCCLYTTMCLEHENLASSGGCTHLFFFTCHFHVDANHERSSPSCSKSLVEHHSKHKPLERFLIHLNLPFFMQSNDQDLFNVPCPPPRWWTPALHRVMTRISSMSSVHLHGPQPQI